MIYNENDANETLPLTEEADNAQSQARAQYECIVEMVERLDHLRTCDCEYDQYQEDNDLCDAGIKFDSEEEFDEYHNENDAQRAIDEDPLSVQVRSGWASSPSEFEAEEFEILLCTGGPACRIRGEIGQHGEPSRAWLEYQDWGTPWTQYFGADQSTLVSYAQNFYFGE